VISDLPNKDILFKLKNSANVLEFILKLKPDELESFKEILSWPPPLLSKFKKDPQHLAVLHKVWDIVPDRSDFMQVYLAAHDYPAASNVNVLDAFSSGQLKSKSWLLDTVGSLDLNLGRTWVLCGWIGTLGYLMINMKDRLKFKNIRSFDIDPNCHYLADTLNRPFVKDNWLFKASTLDVNELRYDNFQYETIKYDGTSQVMFESADTIINTSCDHMGEDDNWWHNIPGGKLVILQNNDFDSVDEHNNTVSSIHEFRDMYPMEELLFSGTIDCTAYNRFMLIGKK
jgi:hypothetical protein